jgi:peptide/nickel transport system permease protein
LGTAPGQIDIYYSLVWGSRSALILGLTITVTTALIGILLGAVGGYAGGMFHGLTLRVTDAFLAFPVISGVWLLQQVLMPASPFAELSPIQQAFFNLGLSPILLTLIAFSWMPYARLTSANVMQLKQTEYVQAARSIGARRRRIIGRHLLPNVLPSVIVLGARDVGAMVILTAAFTFIGLGGSTEWGDLLAKSRDYIIGSGGNPLTYWWVFVPVTLALILFGIGWNLLGDGLNTVLDPRIAR